MKITCVEVDEYHPRELVIRFDSLEDQSRFLGLLEGIKLNGRTEEVLLASHMRASIMESDE